MKKFIMAALCLSVTYCYCHSTDLQTSLGPNSELYTSEILSVVNCKTSSHQANDAVCAASGFLNKTVEHLTNQRSNQRNRIQTSEQQFELIAWVNEAVRPRQSHFSFMNYMIYLLLIE